MIKSQLLFKLNFQNKFVNGLTISPILDFVLEQFQTLLSLSSSIILPQLFFYTIESSFSTSELGNY